MSFIPDSYHYLVINLLIIAYPLAQSFESRIRFLSEWKAIFTAIAIAGGLFLAWDELFAALGVWGFNDTFVMGIYIGRLPIEEFGFFMTAPFACLFIYEVLNYLVKRDILGKHRLSITWFFLLSCMVLGVLFYPRLYSSASFFFAAILLALQLFRYKSAWLGRFFLAYFFTLIPFFFMNSWLTGSFTSEPIVWYNNLENMRFRLGTIPLEDLFYQLGYFLLVVWIYERNKLRKPHFGRTS
jgi:lycopene cyclase domain-containing protein